MTALQDVRNDAQLVETHIDAGHGNPNHAKFPDFLIDLDTFVKNANRVRYQYHPPATIDERLSFLVSTAAAIDRRTETLVSDISGLQAAVDKLGTDATADHDAIIAAFAATQAALADLTAQVAALTAGQISQDTIDALTAAATAADQAFNDTAAAVVPVVTP